MRGSIQVSPGFWLLIAWFGWINGWGLLAVILGAAALHEVGHWLVLRAAGAEIRGFRVGLCGAVLETDTEALSYGWELASILAGPLTNLGCAFLLLLLRGDDASVGVHLSLFAFNMLPLRPLDGGRALSIILSWLWGPDGAERVTRAAGAVCGLGLAGLLLWLMGRTGGSLWLLPAAVGLGAAGWRECFR